MKSTAECRAAPGDCDVAESCNGVDDDCPVDGFVGAGTECRGAAGVCDLAEVCTGSSADCPTDLKSTAECRAAPGDCDVAESCDGVDDDCPADGFVGAGTECRPAVDQCDLSESCTGSSADCPADANQPNGTSCEDGLYCNVGETCQGGVCIGGGARDCSDGVACTADICDEDGDTCLNPEIDYDADGYGQCGPGDPVNPDGLVADCMDDNEFVLRAVTSSAIPWTTTVTERRMRVRYRSCSTST